MPGYAALLAVSMRTGRVFREGSFSCIRTGRRKVSQDKQKHPPGLLFSARAASLLSITAADLMTSVPRSTASSALSSSLRVGIDLVGQPTELIS